MALDLRAGAGRRRTLSSETLPGLAGRRRARKSIAVNRPAEECYRFWRNVESFPSFMQHIDEVRVIDERRSHWCASALAGRRVEWDVEITDDQPNRLIAWRTAAGSQADNAGRVCFTPAPAGKGTMIEVDMEYRLPAGTAGAMAATLFGLEPAQQLEGDLRRFKQLVETGEITTTRGQAHGPRTLKARLFNKEAEQ